MQYSTCARFAHGKSLRKKLLENPGSDPSWLLEKDFRQQKIGGERKGLRLTTGAFQERLEHFVLALLDNSERQNLEQHKFVAHGCVRRKKTEQRAVRAWNFGMQLQPTLLHIESFIIAGARVINSV